MIKYDKMIITIIKNLLYLKYTLAGNGKQNVEVIEGSLVRNLSSSGMRVHYISLHFFSHGLPVPYNNKQLTNLACSSCIRNIVPGLFLYQHQIALDLGSMFHAVRHSCCK